MAAKLNEQELTDLLAQEFPQTNHMDLSILQAGDMTATVHLKVTEQHLRPGETVSGPTLFWIADLGLYVAVMAMLGPVTQAVTTSMNVNFLRRPPLADLTAKVRLLKLGRRLAVGEVAIYSDGIEDPVAHMTGTYAIPPEKA